MGSGFGGRDPESAVPGRAAEGGRRATAGSWSGRRGLEVRNRYPICYPTAIAGPRAARAGCGVGRDGAARSGAKSSGKNHPCSEGGLSAELSPGSVGQPPVVQDLVG